jgi:membrane peptidoglycan carboxypeptidase
MITAANAIAASGYLMRPQLSKEVRSPEGKVLVSFEPEPVRRVVSRETATRLRDILVGVVERGTGTRALIPGYRVAGKTGTAQKAVPGGGYSKTDFVASFVGFVPAHRPALTALVILDSPSKDHSGSRAARVFAEIVEPSLHYLGVPPEVGKESIPMVARWPQQPPLFLRSSPTLNLHRLAPVTVGRSPMGEEIRMPALYGFPARDAVARLVAERLVPRIVGSGWVVRQEPSGGEPVSVGSQCTLILGPRGDVQIKTESKIVDYQQHVLDPDRVKEESGVVEGASL